MFENDCPPCKIHICKATPSDQTKYEHVLALEARKELKPWHSTSKQPKREFPSGRKIFLHTCSQRLHEQCLFPSADVRSQ